jgi:hypothetical protein
LVLILEEPTECSLLLDYVFRTQQQRVLAIADEIMGIEMMMEVIINFYYYWLDEY